MLLGRRIQRRLHLNWVSSVQPHNGRFLLRSMCEEATLLFGTRSLNESHPEFATLWDKIGSSRQSETHISILKEWKEAGNSMHKDLMNSIICKLCTQSCYTQALKVTSWLDEQNTYELTDEDLMIRLQVLCNAGSVVAAKGCFDKITRKSENTYLAMLRGYNKRHRITLAEKLFSELVASNLMKTAKAYTVMFKMYVQSEEHLKKTASLYEQYVASEFSPDAEMCLALIKFGGKISSRIPVGERIEAELQKLKVTPKNMREMLKLYGEVRNAEGVNEAWKAIEASPPVLLNEYVAAVTAYGQVGDVKNALKLSKKVEPMMNNRFSTDYILTMLEIYTENGMMGKVERFMDKVKLQDRPVDFRHCYVLVDAYLHLGMEKQALEWFNYFTSKQIRHPLKQLADCMVRLNEDFAENQDVDSAEKLMAQVPEVKDAGVYNSLMKVYIAAETGVQGMKERMVAAGVTFNDESNSLLKMLKRFTVLEEDCVQ